MKERMAGGSPGMVMNCLAVALCVAAFLFLLPFFWQAAPKLPPPPLAWAPGYWETSPLLGITRIVPLAPAELVNPAASTAPAEVQADKNIQPIDRTDL